MPELRSLSVYRSGQEVPLSWSRVTSGGSQPILFGPPAVALPVAVSAVTSTVVPSGTSNKAAPAPAIQESDFVVFCLAVQGTTTNVAGAALPPGFTSRSDFTRPSNRNLRFIIGTKLATASEPSSYTPVIPSGVTSRSDVIVLTNVDRTRIATTSAVESPASTTYTAPSVTPSTDHGAALFVVVNSGGDSWTPPADTTELTDLYNNASPYLSMTVAFLATSGTAATGARTFTTSGNFTGISTTIYLPAAGSA